MSFISGVLQSLIASLIFYFLRTESKTRNQAAFKKRSKLFHEKISPYLLNTVLPEMHPDIYKKLYTANVNNYLETFPFIELNPVQKITISKRLQTSKRTFSMNYKLIKWLKEELEKKLTNDPTFIIYGVSSSYELSIGIGDYFSTISTSDIHYLNLIRYFPLNTKYGSYFSYRHGRYVSEWINSLSTVVLDHSYSHYCASIGCSVLTVLKGTDGRYKYLIKKSSSTKGSSSVFEHHVIPSFMFQPSAIRESEQERELDLELSVVREYGEELLGMSELERPETVDVLLEKIRNNTLLNNLQNKIKNGEVILRKTGFIMDIYRLRPEITFLLIISDDDYSKNIRTNWEIEKHSLDLIRLDDDDTYFELLKSSKTPLCAPGVAALIYGRNLALEMTRSI